MSQFISSVKERIPDRVKRIAGGVFDRPDTSHATHPSDTPVWQTIKRYAYKFWVWFKTDNWKWVLATLIIAGIVHILAVLNLPNLAPKSAWSRLQEDIPVNKMVLLEELDKKPGILPMMAPDIRYAICRYDLTGGPVTIKTKVPNDLFSVGAYDQLGQNFYIISGQSLQRSELYMVVTQNKDTAETEVSASEKSDDVVVINSVAAKGIILLRVPVTGTAYQAKIETFLQNSTCIQEKK